MRSVFVFTIIIVITSVYSQHPLLRNLETLQKAVPNHWKNDQEKFDGRMDKVPWGHQIEAHLPHLRPHQTIPWKRWVQEGRLTAQANRNTELHRVRARLLEEKLKPNHLIFKPHIKPQNKPKLKTVHNVRTKRETDQENEGNQPVLDEEQHIRQKRSEIIAPQFIPEMVMQPHIQAASIQLTEPQYQGRIADSEKRDKRQILIDIIDQPTQLMARIPRTTPNPFIRETNIDDYDIIRPEVGEREGIVPKVDSIYSEIENFPLMNEEASEFSKVITQFYVDTSSENWADIQRFALNVINPVSNLKKTLNQVFTDNYPMLKEEKILLTFQRNENHKIRWVEKEFQEIIQKRVKRKVDKTLQRKRAKKKKQKQRRVERKRLRMLTHARRVRRQQKSKQARLQRHYARMNMTTTQIPEHMRNQTIVEDLVEESKYELKSNNEEYEYESSESVKNQSNKQDNKVNKNGEKTDKLEENESGGENSKPDDGNDDYDEYEDYEDDEDDEVSNTTE